MPPKKLRWPYHRTGIPLVCLLLYYHQHNSSSFRLAHSLKHRSHPCTHTDTHSLLCSSHLTQMPMSHSPRSPTPTLQLHHTTVLCTTRWRVGLKDCHLPPGSKKTVSEVGISHFSQLQTPFLRKVLPGAILLIYTSNIFFELRQNRGFPGTLRRKKIALS